MIRLKIECIRAKDDRYFEKNQIPIKGKSDLYRIVKYNGIILIRMA